MSTAPSTDVKEELWALQQRIQYVLKICPRWQGYPHEWVAWMPGLE